MNDETKILTETETFFPETEFSKTETFLWDQIFRNQDSFPRANFPKPKPSKNLNIFEKMESYTT